MADEETPATPEEQSEEVAQEETVADVQEDAPKLEVEQDVIKEIPAEDEVEESEGMDLSDWNPKTEIGKKVKSGEINSMDQILNTGQRIFEEKIVEALLPGLEQELLFIGQSKGKFGGGAKRIFRQTQKKTPEGNKPSFACFAVVGNNNGYVGGGFGKSKDTVPAREKAIRMAKLNVFKVRRGCGSWQCHCGKPHSIPFAVKAKCGSVEIELLPAPRGKGLIIEEECAKILRLAGIQDVWSKTQGQTKVKTNLIDACVAALKQLMLFKISEESAQQVGSTEGLKRVEQEE